MQASAKRNRKVIIVFVVLILAILVILFNFNFIKSVSDTKSYWMNLVHDQNDRYDWLLNEENIESAEKVYSIGRVDDKYLFVFEIDNKYLIHVYEIAEYKNIQIENLEYKLNENLNKIEINPKGSGNWRYLTFDTKLDTLIASKLKLYFSEKSNASIIDKNESYFYLKTHLDKLAIFNENGDCHFEIYHDNNVVPTNFLFLKGQDSFFMISIYAMDYSELSDSTLLKMLNL